MKKYELVPVPGSDMRGWHRIKSLINIRDNVKIGDLGGLIAHEGNLDHEGYAWVFERAQVSGSARVSGNAQVYDDARVFGDARVSEDAQVSGSAQVSGDAQVSDCAQVSGHGDLITITGAAITGHHTISVYRCKAAIEFAFNSMRKL